MTPAATASTPNHSSARHPYSRRLSNTRKRDRAPTAPSAAGAPSHPDPYTTRQVGCRTVQGLCLGNDRAATRFTCRLAQPTQPEDKGLVLSTGTYLDLPAPTAEQRSGSDDMELTPAAITNGVGVVSVAVWLLWMLGTGRLVTRREHENRVSDLKDRLHVQDETIESLTGSVQKQTVNGDLTVSLLRSIDRTASEKSGGE